MSFGNRSGKSPANGSNSPLHVIDLRYPGAYPSESEDEGYSASISQPKSRERVTFADPVGSNKGKRRETSSGYDSTSGRRGPPTPISSPPVGSLSPHSRNPSRMGSSVAESFRTALEDPWFSSDNVSSFRSFPNSPYLNGQPHGPTESKDTVIETDGDLEGDADNTPTQSQIDLPKQAAEPPNLDLENLENVRARDWDSPIMRSNNAHQVETQISHSTPEQESPVDREITESVPISATTSSTATSQGPITPPTTYLTNGVWHTPPKANGYLSTANSSPQRGSVKSSASTVIEAIIVTTPKQEPRALRRVNAAASLRDQNSLLTIGPTSRVASDSVTIRPRHRHAPTGEPSLGFTYERSPKARAVTEPQLRRTQDRNSLRDDLARSKPVVPNTFEKPYHQRTSSEQSPPPSPPMHIQMENPFTSHLQRGLSIGSQRSRVSHHSARGSTHRALQNVLDPSFSPRPSSQADSVVTVIKKQSVVSGPLETTPTYPVASSTAPLIQDPLLEEAVIVVTPSIEEHLVPPANLGGIIRRGSDAGSVKSRFSTNTDRFTLKSEDHPRHLFSQTTPFSQISAFSAREAEVGEAKALEIYPHNNHSLLLVEQSGSSSRTSPPTTLPDTVTVRTREGKEVVYIPEEKLSQPVVNVLPSTPETQQGEFTADVDSPLKNPRKPPLPPKINILPATPMDNENSNPIDSIVTKKTIKPARPTTLLNQARRFSDTLLPSFLSRTGSLSRHNSYRSQRGYSTHSKRPYGPTREESRDKHLHPLWQPRDNWENTSTSDSDFGDIGPDDEEDFGTLPPGGDTSDLPKEGFGYIGRRMTKKLPGFRGTGGFLIGNSLGLARSGTNVRRHHVMMPPGVRDRRGESLDLDARQRTSHEKHDLMHKRSLSNLNLAARRSSSVHSLRSESDRQRRRGRQRKKLHLHVEWIGIGGLRDRWRARKAEKRREELRRSIGPKWVIEQGIGAGNTALTSVREAGTRRITGGGSGSGSSERSQSLPARGTVRPSSERMTSGPPNGRMIVDEVASGVPSSSRTSRSGRVRMNGLLI